MLQKLKLSLLGMPQITLNDTPLTKQLALREQALLFYLAVNGQTYNRSKVAALLWEAESDQQAMKNLRDVLPNLRRQLGNYLKITYQTVSFNRNSMYWLDVEVFQHMVQSTVQTTAIDNPARLRQALELYRGDFLADFFVRGAPDFENWLLIQRQQLQALAIQGWHSLVTHYIEQEEDTAGINAVQRLLTLDPWYEPAYQQQMLLLARNGQRSAALAQYAVCQRVLATELNVTPSAATVALYEQIRNEDLPIRATSTLSDLTGKNRLTAVARLQENNRAGGEHTLAQTKPGAVYIHNLPRLLTPLIGRQMEIIALRNKLLEPHYALLTLTGEGGIGKTHLAIAVAESVFEHFPDGVWFVSLFSITPGPDLYDQLATTIGAAMKITFGGATALFSQLVAQLHAKRMLLVLDNFEHLIDGASFVMEMLQQTQSLKVLVTSRQRLNFLAEYSFRLDGLSIPDEEEAQVLEKAQLLGYEGVALFVECASRIRSTFQPAEDLDAIIRICQLVSGSPLGIKLAATLVRQQSCAQIATSLGLNYKVLTSNLRDLPVRHQSMQAVLAASWQLLSAQEATTLARCSLFCGGFTVEAAAFVSGATLDQLMELEDHSLIYQSGIQRYELHALVRQYATEQLRATPNEEEQTYARYCTYYTDFLATHHTTLRNMAQTRQLVQLELNNVRAAWQWAVEHTRTDALQRGMNGLRVFYDLAGFYHEAATVFQQASTRVQQLLAESVQPQPHLQQLHGHLLSAHIHFCIHLALFDKVGPLIEEVIQAGQTIPAPILEAAGLQHLGTLVRRQGDLAAAATLLERALALARHNNEVELIGSLLCALAVTYGDQGEVTRAIAYCLDALTFAHQVQNRVLECMLVHNLGLYYLTLGELGQASHYAYQNIQISRELEAPRQLAYAYCDMAYLLTVLGNISHAHHYYTEALQVFRSVGNRVEEASVLYNLGSIFSQMGEAKLAYTHCQQALQIIEEKNLRWHSGNAFMYLGHALVGLKRFTEARHAYEQSLAVWQEINYPSPIAEVRAALAFTYLQQGEFAQALTLVEEILQPLAHIVLDISSEPVRIFLICYRVLAANEDPRAADILQRGYQLVQTLLATIEDEELRHSFLNNVAANREVIALVNEGERLGIGA